MSLKIGIVGLPNVGKSTLFNALTKSKGAEAANYPFCTIDPNIGIVEVPDKRITTINSIQETEKIIPATIEFVDIAGLVKGASQGEGLGNKFLSHIRECAVIAQVLRIFEDDNIIHVHGNVDPKRDMEVIEAELLLADLQTVEKRLQRAQSEAKSGDKEKKAVLETVEKVANGLREFKKALDLDLSDDENLHIKDLHLLTMKPIIYIVNVKEDEIGSVNIDDLKKKLEIPESTQLIPICAHVEEELLGFDDEEAKEYLEALGLKESGLNALIHAAYSTLNLISYFTVGPKEIHAWTITRNMTAPQAAGKIHTDFEKGFIRAEVMAYADYEKHKGEAGAKENGALRMEGKDYIVKDGDIMHFHFNS